MSESLFRPGVRLGSYPQKQESALTEFEQNAAVIFEKIRALLTPNKFNQTQIVKKIGQYEDKLKACSEQDLTVSIMELKEKLGRYGLTEALVAQSFATIRESAARTLGKRHYEVQLFGGWLMINGLLAEMATGEGKTLTTTLPARTAAMAGIPVHVITANDYLATRDAEIMRPLYHRLGLSGIFIRANCPAATLRHAQIRAGCWLSASSFRTLGVRRCAGHSRQLLFPSVQRIGADVPIM